MSYAGDTAPLEQQILAVQQALTAVYNGRGEEHRNADRWLQDFQTRPAAWQVADALLMRPGTDLQAKFFGAMTIHNKIKYDFRQLPQESVPSLRLSLLSHITRCAQQADRTQEIVLKRLCLSIATLAVQINWPDIVLELTQSFMAGLVRDTQQQDRAAGVVLELLKVLPEECCNSHVIVDDRQRYDFLQQLRASYPSLLQFLQQVGGQGGLVGQVGQQLGRAVAMQETLYQCLKMWIRYADIPAAQLARHTMLPSAFDALATPDLFETCIDVLVEALRVYEDPRESADVVQIMVPRAMALRQGYLDSVAAEDTDEARGYVRLFTEMGESYLPLILQDAELGQLALVQLVVLITAHPVHEIATIPLHFWYRLSHGLARLEPADVRERKIAQFRPCLDELIEILVRLMRYPEDFEVLSEDQVDDLKRHRYDVSDVLLDCCGVIGTVACLAKLLALLEGELSLYSQLSPKLSAEERQSTWQAVEACLFGIRSIIKPVPEGEAQVMPAVMDILLQLPSDTHIRYTANLIVGNAAGWLRNHPAKLQQMFDFLMQQGFNSHECATATATSIKSLCKQCGQCMGEPVLALHDQLQAARAQSGGVSTLQIKDELEILEGLCYVVSALTPLEAVVRGLHRLVQPIANDMQNIVREGQQQQQQQQLVIQQGGGGAAVEAAGSAGSKPAMRELDRLTCVIRNVQPVLVQGQTHPILEVIGGMWGLLEQLQEQNRGSEYFAERLCRCYKHALRACRSQFEPLLPGLVSQMVLRFAQVPLSPYLYCSSICVTEFAQDTRFHPLLMSMLRDLSATAFSTLTSPEQFTAHPDMVEEYFYLAARFLTHCPAPLLQDPLLLDIVRCAVAGLRLDHREAHKGILHFVEELLNIALFADEGGQGGQQQTGYRQRVEQLLGPEGQGLALAHGLVGCIVGELPTYALDVQGGSVAGVLWKLSLLSPSRLREWLVQALQGVGEAIYRASQKEELIHTLLPQDPKAVDREAFMTAIRDCSHSARQNARRWNTRP